MIRRNRGVIRVTGVLQTVTPIRVGAGSQTDDVDLPVMRDGRGWVLIPGTSLAGAARAWCLDHGVDSGTIDQIFGSLDEGSGASWLWFHDSSVNASVEIRNGIGIDRRTGSVAEHVLYSYEVLPRGTKLPFFMEAEVPLSSTGPTEEDVYQVVKILLGGFRRGDIRLGGGQTRGLGQVRLLDGVSVRRHRFDDATSTLRALEGGDDEADLVQDFQIEESPALSVSVEWKSFGCVMSADGGEGLAVDTLPLTGLVDGEHLSVVLPGSGIKGVLRQRAEYVARTLQGSPLPTPDSATDTNHIDQVCSSVLVNALFGESKESSDEGQPARGRRGAVSIADCYGTVSIDEKTWRQIVDSKEMSSVVEAVRNVESGNVFAPLQHNAVDRWTGGAAEDGRLFSVLEVREPNWEPLRLSLNLSVLSRQPRDGERRALSNREQQAAIGLLLVVLSDLVNNRLRFGYGTLRGSGRMVVDSVKFGGREAVNLFGKPSDLPEAEFVQPFLDALRAELMGDPDAA